MAEGIEIRHRKGCRSLSGGRCGCQPTYRAAVWSNRERKQIRRSFATVAEAKSWRSQANAALRQGTLRAPTPTTIADAAEAWLEGARAGQILNRSGEPYKPSAVRGYEKALRREVLPAFGRVKLTELRLIDLQDFVDELHTRMAPATIVTVLNPLRAIYRRAINRGEVAINPTRGLAMPAVTGRRERFASPEEAKQLIQAVRKADRPIWATAMYAGLRRGELRALLWENVDLAGGVIRVERSWDDIEGPIGLKSRAGRRMVPIPGVLRDYLDEHRLRTGGEGLVFGAERPFDPSRLIERADLAWDAASEREREAAEVEGRDVDESKLLERITLHECRHTFASLMIAAGVNAKALSTFMGHANISITLDRYGHLMPGSELEAAGMLDTYLARSEAREAAKARETSASPA